MDTALHYILYLIINKVMNTYVLTTHIIICRFIPQLKNIKYQLKIHYPDHIYASITNYQTF